MVAPCCTNWAATCYTSSDVESNNHACNQCGGDPCFGVCDWSHADFADSSDECRDCCITTVHETPWNCPSTYTI